MASANKDSEETTSERGTAGSESTISADFEILSTKEDAEIGIPNSDRGDEYVTDQKQPTDLERQDVSEVRLFL